MKKAFAEFKQTRVDCGKDLAKIIELALANKQAEALALIKGSFETTSRAEMSAIEKIMTMKEDQARVKSDENTVKANAAVTTMLIF